MDREYLDYYEIPEKYKFTPGEFDAGSYRIWSWSLEPEKWEATVMILHGFLDHSLSNRKLILRLLGKGFRIIAGDMPGHGRSSGIRGGVLDFEDYNVYFDNLLAYWKINPLYTFAIGHSTGSSILINYCRRKKECLRGIVLAAPLVKMNWHILLDRSIDLAHDWIKVLPVKKTKSSHNKAFLKFKWKDPLGVRRFSLDWIKAMVEWNRDWEDFASEQNILILQGKKDNVVEWKTNIPQLERCFTRCETVYFKKGRHHILNESERIGKDVISEIDRFLEE